MQFHDQQNAINSKRIKSNYQKAQLLPVDKSEKFGLQFSHGLEFGQTSSSYWGMVDDYDSVNKEIKNAFGVDLPNPLIDPMAKELAGDNWFSNWAYYFSQSQSKKGAGQTTIGNYKDHIEWWNKEVEKLQQDNPNTNFNNLDYFMKAREKKAQTQEFLISEMQQASRGFMEKWGTSLGSGFLTYMTDPVVMTTLPLSFAYSVPRNLASAMLKTAIMEGALEFGRSGLVEAGVQPYKKQLGLSYGVDQALMNMFMATAGGAVLAPVTLAAFRGAGVGVKAGYRGTKKAYLSIDEMISKNYFPQRFAGMELNKLIDGKTFKTNNSLHTILHQVDDETLLKIFDELPDNIKNNPEWKAAAYNLKQAIIEKNQNPYENTVAGNRQHSDNFKQAHEQVANDQPINVSEDATIALKKPDIAQAIKAKEAEISGLQSVLDDTVDDGVPLGLKKSEVKTQKAIKKEINQAKKELKELKDTLKNKFPDEKRPSGLEYPKEPKVQRFLNWLQKNKIKSDDYNIGDVRGILDKSTFRFIKKGGNSLDYLLTRAREDGWLPPAKPNQVDDLDINAVLDLISENPVHPSQTGKMIEYDMNVKAIDEQISVLEDAGYNINKMTNEDVDIAWQKVANRVDDQDLKKYSNEEYIDDFSQENFDEVMDFFDEKIIDPKQKFVMEVDAEGNPTKSMTAKQIKNDLQNEKTMLDELTKCKGVEV